ncbi:MAG TPA: GTPase [Limnochordia bacterium]
MGVSYCDGCGVVLQSDLPEAPGYIPAHVLAEGRGGLLCRRCYRITHYGKEAMPLARGVDLSHDTLRAAIRDADIVLWLLDAIDLEGTFDRRAAELARGKLWVIVNKADLLPARTPRREVREWVARRLAREGVGAEEIFLISAARGEGVSALFDRIAALARPRGRGNGRLPTLLLFGATNVGKSTLLNAWQERHGGEAPPSPATVSPFPGTTQALLGRTVGGLRIIDAPGFFSSGRMGDLLCSNCASLLVPSHGLSSSLHRLRPGQAVIFGGLAAIELTALHGRAAEEPPASVDVLAFAARSVTVHRTRGERIQSLLTEAGREWLQRLCERCRRHIEATGWEEALLSVREEEDLAIHGLGWISVRGAGITARVIVPAGVQAQVRPRLVGPKRAARRVRRRPRLKSEERPPCSGS